MNRQGNSQAHSPFSEHLLDVMLVASGLDWDLERAVPVEQGEDIVYRLDIRGEKDIPSRAVLKAAGSTTDTEFKHEPKLLQYIRHNTSIPVPRVYATHLDPIDLPAPYYVMEYAENQVSVTNTSQDLFNDLDTPRLLARIAADAGRHLALFHQCESPTKIGKIGVVDESLRVIETDSETWSDYLRPIVSSEQVPWDMLEDVSNDLQQYLSGAIDDIPNFEPVPGHLDYRFDNLAIDSDEGVVNVLDWGGARTVHDIYELVLAEQYLSRWAPLDSKVRATVRNHLYDSYASHRRIDSELVSQYRKPYFCITRLTALMKEHSHTGTSPDFSEHASFFREAIY